MIFINNYFEKALESIYQETWIPKKSSLYKKGKK